MTVQNWLHDLIAEMKNQGLQPVRFTGGGHQRWGCPKGDGFIDLPVASRVGDAIGYRWRNYESQVRRFLATHQAHLQPLQRERASDKIGVTASEVEQLAPMAAEIRHYGDLTIGVRPAGSTNPAPPPPLVITEVSSPMPKLTCAQCSFTTDKKNAMGSHVRYKHSGRPAVHPPRGAKKAAATAKAVEKSSAEPKVDPTTVFADLVTAAKQLVTIAVKAEAQYRATCEDQRRLAKIVRAVEGVTKEMKWEALR